MLKSVVKTGKFDESKVWTPLQCLKGLIKNFIYKVLDLMKIKFIMFTRRDILFAIQS